MQSYSLIHISGSLLESLLWPPSRDPFSSDSIHTSIDVCARVFVCVCVCGVCMDVYVRMHGCVLRMHACVCVLCVCMDVSVCVFMVV